MVCCMFRCIWWCCFEQYQTLEKEIISFKIQMQTILGMTSHCRSSNLIYLTLLSLVMFVITMKFSKWFFIQVTRIPRISFVSVFDQENDYK